MVDVDVVFLFFVFLFLLLVPNLPFLLRSNCRTVEAPISYSSLFSNDDDDDDDEGAADCVVVVVREAGREANFLSIPLPSNHREDKLAPPFKHESCSTKISNTSSIEDSSNPLSAVKLAAIVERSIFSNIRGQSL